jgi:hypothetical protein
VVLASSQLRITIGAGLTYTSSPSGANIIYTFTGGTDTVTFN